MQANLHISSIGSDYLNMQMEMVENVPRDFFDIVKRGTFQLI